MKRKTSISLLWKMLIWLVLHLALLALVVVSMGIWQLHSGLDVLLRGPAGDRLRVAGEQMSSQLRQREVDEWEPLMQAFSRENGVQCDLWLPHGEWATHTISGVPTDVMERLKPKRNPAGPGPGPRNPPRGGSPGRGGPPGPGGPLGRGDPMGIDDFLDEGDPEIRELLGPPRDGPPGRGPGNHPRAAAGDLGFQPVRPIFFMADAKREAYWVAMHVPLMGRAGPDHVVWLIRADSLSGNGLFFDVTPWVVGGLGLLVFSFLFWVPFALHITRYVAKLKHATDRIADGSFDVKIDATRRDELGSLGAAIQSMASRLDHLIKGQKRFLGDVAHELCSPLARLRTGLGILESRLPEAEQARLAAIEEEARELAELIDEILAFSRASAGLKQVQGVKIALRPLVDEIIAREAAHASVECAVDDSLYVRADAKLLKRAVGNLLRNALRYAGENARIRVVASRGEGEVSLSVIDNGPGVPQEEIAHLFEPFYRPDTARTRETGGTGLGLTIVKSCIEACGGNVSARNEKPSGFCVEMQLPAVIP